MPLKALHSAYSEIVYAFKIKQIKAFLIYVGTKFSRRQTEA
jgi:hypothetical protein